MLRTTQLSLERDIKPAYVKMIKVANEQIFDGKLSGDPQLFIEQDEMPYESTYA